MVRAIWRIIGVATLLRMLGRVNGEMMEELAKALANALGWDEERKSAEVARSLLLLTDRHGVRI